MTKKRILFVCEFSELATGFSTYTHHLMPRLHASDKYEIAELAVYCNPMHPGIHKVPWKVYPNEPHPQDTEARKVFDSNQVNQFGKFNFEQVCLEFQPDIVVSICDPWMCSFIEYSPYRKYFKWIYMPTVDGEPQKEEWIRQYKSADKLLTYSVWGKNLLERQTNNAIQVAAAASPGTDLEIFTPPESKAEAKKTLGLQDNIFLMQTVMRNQPRKLFPDLFKAFAAFLEKCKQEGNQELAERTYLHIHTTNPDVGWDLPTEMRRNSVSHKILFTYLNEQTGQVFLDFYHGNDRPDYSQPGTKARLPNTTVGITREQLANLMKAADLYLQYSICEGFGMPIPDAKACGTPVMAVDYSAMSEQVNIDGCIPLKPQRMYQEPQNQTNQLRSMPDNEDTGLKMYDFFMLSQEERDVMGQKCRDNVERFYNWDRVDTIWQNVFDRTLTLPQQLTWKKPLQLIEPNLQIPDNLSNAQFVEWCYTNIIKDPQLLNNAVAIKTIHSLNDGFEITPDQHGRPHKTPITREHIVNNLLGRVRHANNLENFRYHKIVAPPQERKEFSINEV